MCELSEMLLLQMRMHRYVKKLSCLKEKTNKKISKLNKLQSENRILLSKKIANLRQKFNSLEKKMRF